MGIFSNMKLAQDENDDYGYDEFYCEQCSNYNKCKEDENERCETWYEEGRD